MWIVFIISHFGMRIVQLIKNRENCPIMLE